MSAEARESTLATWQQGWAEEMKGWWTLRLIPSISEWAKREHGEVNFYLTQFLTGHEYFRKYLYNLNRFQTPLCKSCGQYEDTAEHTFFVCPRWNGYREQTEETIGTLTP